MPIFGMLVCFMKGMMFSGDTLLEVLSFLWDGPFRRSVDSMTSEITSSLIDYYGMADSSN